MTNEEIIAYQAKERAFAETPVGAAFNRFKNAHARAWQMDTEDSFTDKDRKGTKEAWKKAEAAEAELRSLLDAHPR